MDRFQYLGLLGLCLLLTLPLELVFKARVWRQPRRLMSALWPVVAIFAAWDVWSISRHHWTFSRRLTTGIELPLGLPLEELVFFVVVPICGLLTFEAVRTVLGERERNGR